MMKCSSYTYYLVWDIQGRRLPCQCPSSGLGTTSTYLLPLPAVINHDMQHTCSLGFYLQPSSLLLLPATALGKLSLHCPSLPHSLGWQEEGEGEGSGSVGWRLGGDGTGLAGPGHCLAAP